MMTRMRGKVMIDPLYSLVFTTGFLGSGHCIGMCGPIVAALSLAEPKRQNPVFYHLLYNGGRLSTYALIGFAAGYIGSLLNETHTLPFIGQGILILADLFVIIIGLRTSGLFKQLAFIHLEIPGSVAIVSKTANLFRRLPTLAAAYPTGMVMGLLPCGFLYAIALAAAGRGDPVKGGLIMLAFGLGTLPALFFFGSAVHWLSTTMREELLRWAGFIVVVIGSYNLYQHIRIAGWFG